jgi:hypothetical protein
LPTISFIVGGNIESLTFLYGYNEIIFANSSFDLKSRGHIYEALATLRPRKSFVRNNRVNGAKQ